MRTTSDPNTSVLKVEQIDYEDVLHDIVRVHRDHRPGTRAGQVMVVETGGRTIRAVARGSKGNRRDVIAMDQKTRKRLSANRGKRPSSRSNSAIASMNGDGHGKLPRRAQDREHGRHSRAPLPGDGLLRASGGRDGVHGVPT